MTTPIYCVEFFTGDNGDYERRLNYFTNEKDALQCQRNYLIVQCEGFNITTVGKSNQELSDLVNEEILDIGRDQYFTAGVSIVRCEDKPVKVRDEFVVYD